METPCQKIVWDVLPAIRAAIAVELCQVRSLPGAGSTHAGDCTISGLAVPFR